MAPPKKKAPRCEIVKHDFPSTKQSFVFENHHSKPIAPNRGSLSHRNNFFHPRQRLPWTSWTSKEHPLPKHLIIRVPAVRFARFFFRVYGGFLKWWYPTTMGFPTKNGHFGVFWGENHYFRKPPYFPPTRLGKKTLSAKGVYLQV